MSYFWIVFDFFFMVYDFGLAYARHSLFFLVLGALMAIIFGGHVVMYVVDRLTDGL